MKSLQRFILIGAAGLMTALQAPAEPTTTLFEYAFNIDNIVTNGSAPAPYGVNLAGFDTLTGLGTVLVTIGTAGDHYVGLYVDHEVTENENTFYNEYGSAVGSPGTGQSWEIDEPGWVFGDIYTNFTNSDLDNTNSVPQPKPNDVSMAIAWKSSFAAGDTVKFVISTSDPGRFFLKQNDRLTETSIFFSSTVCAAGAADCGSQPAPEPATLALVGLGLLGVVWQARRRPART